MNISNFQLQAKLKPTEIHQEMYSILHFSLVSDLNHCMVFIDILWIASVANLPSETQMLPQAKL
jgi:hypothetical protein